MANLSPVKMEFWQHELKLAHKWSIASGLKPGGGGGTNTYQVVFVKLTDKDGVVGMGEAAPSSRYKETAAGALALLAKVDPACLKSDDIAGTMEYVNGLSEKDFAGKGAINMALLDIAGKRAQKPIYEMLGLGFREKHHLTSYSIGIDTPEMIKKKVLEAEKYPVLKLKVGSPQDREMMAVLREVAPTKWIRVDANEGWKTKEEALKNCEWLAADGHVQFVEQPMPDTTPMADLKWLKERSPLPIMGDESYLSAKNVDFCAECYHSVNVKLVKTGGITAGYEALKAARKAGLQTMLGCMIESSILISAAAHLAELTDYLDIDGNLLITNDPFVGATAEKGIVSFAGAPEPYGLRVTPRG